MQAVAQLVRLGADQAGPGHVHRLVELPVRDVVEDALAQLPDLGGHQGDKGLAPADQVLIEAGDGLVHGVGHVVGAVLVVDLLGLVLHEEGVAALVQGGEHVGDEAVLMVVGGDAHVVIAEVGGKGVLRGHQHQGGLPQPLQLQQVAAHGLLPGDGYRAGHEVLPDGLAFRHHPLEQGDDPLLQRGEEAVQLLDAAALFDVVQAGVVIAVLLLVPQVDGHTGVADQIRQSVPEQGEVVGLFRAEPGGIGPVGGQVHLKGELGGDVLGLAPELIEMLDGLFLHRRQPLAVGMQLLDQLFVGLAVAQLVDLLAQNGHVPSGGLQALLRGAALHVEAHLADGMEVGLHLVQNGEELFQFLLIGHNNLLSL